MLDDPEGDKKKGAGTNRTRRSPTKKKKVYDYGNGGERLDPESWTCCKTERTIIKSTLCSEHSANL